MMINVLAVGDVVSEAGLDFLSRKLRLIKREYKIDFTVVNGENAAGLGLLPDQAEDILSAGADVITLGNHTWSKGQIVGYLDQNRYILRPANFSPGLPGQGWDVYDGPRGMRIGVVNLIGRVSMDPNVDNPFTTADTILKKMDADLVLVDFHAEATSEKLAMGWYLDGRAAAVWGTHTHVPTADGQVLPKGTGYITDLGMTGPARSILGIRPEQSINKFLGGLPRRYEAAQGPCKLEGAVFTWDTVEKRCTQVRQIRLD
ncbi:MAG: TIGR00282 family metallophosphoesterase [Oscillospiraceae bacterium]|nr:TIGR00282 family metallophosphoesterase [Oscillospiraceae bacterium]